MSQPSARAPSPESVVGSAPMSPSREASSGTAFISYSRKDADSVKPLHRALTKPGRDVWIDSDRIRPTVEWLREVYEAIERSDAFIYVISPHSIASKICGQELAHAVRHNKRLVPLLYRDVPPASIPEPITKVQWVDFRDGQAFAAALRLLVEALDTDLDWLRMHTRLLTRAIEWDAHAREPSFLLRDKDLNAVQEWLAGTAGKDPLPTVLQTEYVRAGQALQAAELEHLRDLYNRALARQLAAQAELTRSQRASEIERSALLATEAMRRYPCLEADQALRAGLALLPRRKALIPHPGTVNAAVFSPNGRVLVTYSAAPRDNCVWIRDARNGRAVARQEHADHVNALVFSDDGRLFATGDNGGEVRLYDSARWRIVARLPHDDPVSDIVLDSDGRYVVTACGNGVVRVWRLAGRRRTVEVQFENVWRIAAGRRATRLALVQGDSTVRVVEMPSGRELACFGHESAPREVAISRNGRIVATTATDDETARIWTLGAARPIASLPHEDEVRQMLFSADGKLLATASGSIIRLWETDGGRLATELRHDANVCALQFSPDGRRLATASGDNTAGVWDVALKGPVARMPHRAGVVAVALGRGGKTLASAGGRTVQLWETQGVGSMVSLAHGASVTQMAFTPDGKHLITACSDNVVRVWAVSRRRTVARIELDDEIERIALDSDGKLLAVATQADAVELWSIPRGRRLARLAHPAPVHEVALTPDGSYLVSASGSSVHLWSVRRRCLIRRFDHAHRVHRVAFDPSGRRFASSSGDHDVLIHEAGRDRPLVSMVHEDHVRIIAYGPHGDVLATAGLDGGVRLWNAESGQLLGEMAHDANVNALLFTAEGRRLISASGDGSARVWELEGFTEVARITHEKGVAALALSPDGQFIASGSREGTVKVSEAATGRELARMTQLGEVESIGFQPCGKYLATASTDGAARLWLWRPDDLIAQARIGLTRGFTSEEWTQYVGDQPYCHEAEAGSAAWAHVPSQPASHAIYQRSQAPGHRAAKRRSSRAIVIPL